MFYVVFWPVRQIVVVSISAKCVLHRYLVGLGIISLVVLHVGTHPQIRHDIAQSPSWDGYVVFESTNLPKQGNKIQMGNIRHAEPRPFPFLLGE